MDFTLNVIGAGGTGGYFLKEFARYIQGHTGCFKGMYIIDGDTVEEKNVLRQAFQLEDVGFNKAVVMADILRSAFGVKFQAKPDFLEASDEIECHYGSVPLIIGCVDNHQARMVCEKFFNEHDTVFYLDSANEFSTGEVVFSYKVNGKVLSPLRSSIFKMEIGKKRSEMSCEELNNVEPQHIATNMLAGNILLREVCSILDGKPHCGFVEFDTEMFHQEFFPYVPVADKDGEKEAA